MSGANGEREQHGVISRRDFIRRSADAALAGGIALTALGSLGAAALAEEQTTAAELPRLVLGRTGLKVSVLSQGGALTYGPDTLKGDITDQRSRLLLEAADMGVNLFDTYKDKFVSDYACLAKLGEKAMVLYKSETMSAAGTREEVDAALKAMKRERLDLIMPHGHPWAKLDDRSKADAEVKDEEAWKGVIEAMEEMARLKEKGKVGCVGYVSHFPPHFKRVILKHGELVDVIMVRFGPFAQLDVSEEIINMAGERKMGVIAFKTIDGAFTSYDTRLAKWRADQKTWERIKPLVDKGFTPAQACIKYARSRQGVHTVLVGMRSRKELLENVKAAL